MKVLQYLGASLNAYRLIGGGALLCTRKLVIF